MCSSAEFWLHGRPCAIQYYHKPHVTPDKHGFPFLAITPMNRSRKLPAPPFPPRLVLPGAGAETRHRAGHVPRDQEAIGLEEPWTPPGDLAVLSNPLESNTLDRDAS